MLKQLYIFMWWRSTLIQGSDLSIKIYRKHFQRPEVARLGVTPKGNPMCKVNIKFDNIWYLASRT